MVRQYVKDFLKKINIKILSLQLMQIIRTASVFAISIFMAQYCKDITVISHYETLFLVGTGLSFFWVSGLMTTFLPFYYERPESKQGIVIFSAFFSLFILSFFSAFLILLAGILFFKEMSWYLFASYAVYIFFNSPAFLIEYIFLAKNKNRLILYYAFIAFALQVVVFCTVIFLTDSLLAGIISLAVYAFVKFVFLIVILVKYADLHLDFEVIRKYMLKSSPIILSLLIGGSSDYVSSFIVRYFSSESEFAIYRYGAREFPLTRILANSLSVIMSGEIAFAIKKENMHQSLLDLKKSATRLMHIVFPLTFILLFTSKYLFSFFYTSTFESSYEIFNILLMLIVTRTIFPQSVLMGLQRTDLIFKASVIEFLSNLILGALLVYLIGVRGAAIAIVASYYINTAILWFSVHRRGVKVSEYANVKLWISYSLLGWIVLLIN